MTKNLSANLLCAKGLRPTPQRMLVFEYLLAHRTHPTVDTIYSAVSAKMPTFSKTTVYNSLASLVSHGLVRVVRVEDGELRYDGNPSDHGHFKCTVCGGVTDFEMAGVPLPLEGFTPKIVDVYVTGTCKNCGNKKQ